MITQELLDSLWDFAEPAESEQRLRDAAADAASASDAAELRTQIARALGLQERFPEASAVLDTVIGTSPVIAVRLALERGRIENSAGCPDRATPYFEQAAALAGSTGLLFLQIDALHMLGLSDAEGAEARMLRAVPLAADAPEVRTRRWLVSLHNNLGWLYFDRADFDRAMTQFEHAADAAREVGTDQQRRWAADAIQECRAAMASSAL